MYSYLCNNGARARERLLFVKCGYAYFTIELLGGSFMYSYLCNGARARERETVRKMWIGKEEELWCQTRIRFILTAHTTLARYTHATTNILVSNRRRHGAKTRRRGALCLLFFSTFCSFLGR